MTAPDTSGQSVPAGGTPIPGRTRGEDGTAVAPSPVLAVGAVLEREGRLLFIRRGRPPGEGLWSLPGGRVEAGESLGEALRREMLEETSLSIEVGQLVGFVERRGPGYHFLILDFVVSLDSDGQAVAVAGDDASEVAWVEPGNLGSLAMVSGLLEFLVDHGIVPAGVATAPVSGGS
ncbi:MAG: NUDIX hydrolase [Acidimicrobiales bacterium]